jgi:hypothetical protein
VVGCQVAPLTVGCWVELTEGGDEGGWCGGGVLRWGAHTARLCVALSVWLLGLGHRDAYTRECRQAVRSHTSLHTTRKSDTAIGVDLNQARACFHECTLWVHGDAEAGGQSSLGCKATGDAVDAHIQCVSQGGNKSGGISAKWGVRDGGVRQAWGPGQQTLLACDGMSGRVTVHEIPGEGEDSHTRGFEVRDRCGAEPWWWGDVTEGKDGLGLLPECAAGCGTREEWVKGCRFDGSNERERE